MIRTSPPNLVCSDHREVLLSQHTRDAAPHNSIGIQEMSQSLFPLLSSIATPTIAAVLGYFFVLWKYKKEKMWQEKYNAYREILDAIHNMKHWADETYSSCLCLPTIGVAGEEEFHRGYAEARRCVSKYIDIGKLVISDEVAEKLSEMNGLLWEESFRFEDTGMDDNNYSDELSRHAENVKKIIDGRLEEIINLSKKDLK